MRKVLAGGIGIVGLCLIAGVGAALLGPFRESWAARDWPASDCEVVQSGVQETEEGWEPRLTWRYQVGGAGYQVEGHDPRVFSISLDEREARALSDRFPAGKHVPCWYDPRDPIRSVLDRTPPPLSAYAVGVLIVAMMAAGLVAAIFICAFARRPRSPTQAE